LPGAGRTQLLVANDSKNFVRTPMSLSARQRHYGITANQARDERLGSALGRLSFLQMISSQQCDGSVMFEKLYHAHHAIIGLPTPDPQSVTAIMIAGGLVDGVVMTDAPEETIENLHERFNIATNAVDQCDREHRMAAERRPSLVLYRLSAPTRTPRYGRKVISETFESRSTRWRACSGVDRIRRSV
jgi:hypothetical protein